MSITVGVRSGTPAKMRGRTSSHRAFGHASQRQWAPRSMSQPVAHRNSQNKTAITFYSAYRPPIKKISSYANIYKLIYWLIDENRNIKACITELIQQ